MPPTTAASFAVSDRAEKVQANLEKTAKQLDAAAVELQNKLSDLSDRLSNASPSDPQLPALTAQRDAALSEYTQTSTAATQTHTNAQTDDGGLEVYEEAIRPTQPDFPKPMSWAILGSLAVLLIGAAAGLRPRRARRAVPHR